MRRSRYLVGLPSINPFDADFRLDMSPLQQKIGTTGIGGKAFKIVVIHECRRSSISQQGMGVERRGMLRSCQDLHIGRVSQNCEENKKLCWQVVQGRYLRNLSSLILRRLFAMRYSIVGFLAIPFYFSGYKGFVVDWMGIGYSM